MSSTLGGLLVAKRKDAGLTQSALAQASQIPRKWLGRWEHNRAVAFDRDRIKLKVAELAAKGVFIGTSSWKYEGWLDQLYTPARYEHRGKVAVKRFELGWPRGKLRAGCQTCFVFLLFDVRLLNILHLYKAQWHDCLSSEAGVFSGVSRSRLQMRSYAHIARRLCCHLCGGERLGVLPDQLCHCARPVHGVV